jgi:hypothetical protein
MVFEMNRPQRTQLPDPSVTLCVAEYAGESSCQVMFLYPLPRAVNRAAFRNPYQQGPNGAATHRFRGDTTVALSSFRDPGPPQTVHSQQAARSQ